MTEKILFIMPNSTAETFIAAATAVQKYQQKLISMKREYSITFMIESRPHLQIFSVFQQDIDKIKAYPMESSIEVWKSQKKDKWGLIFVFDEKVARELGEATNKNIVECFCNQLGVEYDNCLPILTKSFVDSSNEAISYDIGIMKISNREKLLDFISLNKPQIKVKLIDTDKEIEQIEESLSCKMLIGKQSAATYIMAVVKRLVVEYCEEKMSYRNWLYKEVPNCMMILNPTGIQYITSELCWSTMNRLWNRFPNQ